MTWPVKPLAELADFTLGKMLDQKKNRGELRPYLANVNVRWGAFDLADLREMRFEASEEERYGLRLGDIVMCEGGEPGRCALWNDELPGMMVQKALHRIRAKIGVDPRFLYYSFLQLGRSDGFNGLFTGSTIKHLPREKLAKLRLPLPALAEQQRIAGTLADFDELIDNNRKRIALLEDAARLLYREWFGRLRFPGHEHVQIADGLPAGWERLPLGSVLNLQRGFDLPLGERGDGVVPVYGSTGVVGCHDASKVTGPTLITGRSGSLGTVCYVDEPCWPLNTSLWVTEFKRASPSFAYFLLVDLRLEGFGGGASVPTLDRKVVHAIPVRLPPAPLAKAFDEQVEPIFKQIKLLTVQSEKLAEARDLLLPRLMRGDLVV